MSFYTKSKGIALIVALVKPVAYPSKSYFDAEKYNRINKWALEK